MKKNSTIGDITHVSVFEMDFEEGMPEDQFYNRLVALRQEQKETLQQLEALYAAKVDINGGKFEVRGTSENLENLAAARIRQNEMNVDELQRGYQTMTLEDLEGPEDNQYGSQPPEEVTAKTMWDDVALTDYLEKFEEENNRRLEEIESTLERHRNERLKSDSFKQSVTIPKPFNMTLREYQKPQKKSRSQQIFELEEEERRLAEMKELSKKFKANPVPGHTFLPLYEEMQKRERAYRKNAKETRKLQLKSMEKPFKFAEREQDCARLSKLSKNIDEIIAEENDRPIAFKANPVPKKLLESSIREKMEEEELFRQIRCKLRAEALLRQSKAPISSAESTRAASAKTLANATSRAESAKLTKHKTHDVPDFDEKYKKFLDSVVKNRPIKESTVCKPFQLRTEQKHIAKSDMCAKLDREQSLDFAARNAAKPNFSEVPKQRKNIRSDTIPPKITRSFELMANKNREKLDSAARKNHVTEVEMKHKKSKEIALRKHIASKAAANDNRVLLEEARNKKLQEFKDQQRELQLDYRRKLAEMQNRLENRQLLLEKQSEISAKKEAEKRYLETLRSVGLDEKTITSITGDYGDHDMKLDNSLDLDSVNDDYDYSPDSDFEQNDWQHDRIAQA